MAPGKKKGKNVVSNKSCSSLDLPAPILHVKHQLFDSFKVI
jgi:hypothetical protein